MLNDILKIALTGGIASGKTTVSDILNNHGLDVIDLDLIARDLVAPNSLGLKELVAAFGNGIIAKDGSLNRVLLREKLYREKHSAKIIEDIMHPKIIAKMQKDIANINNKIVIVVVPLLLEKGLYKFFDRAVIVDSTKKNQLLRLRARDNINNDMANLMLNKQASRAERLRLKNKLPTDIINNNADIKSLESQASSLYKKLLSFI